MLARVLGAVVRCANTCGLSTPDPTGRARRRLASSPRPAGAASRTPGGPSEPPVPTYSVTATVFYDQNANGQLDPNEDARVPGVQVVIGTGTGTSAPGHRPRHRHGHPGGGADRRRCGRRASPPTTSRSPPVPDPGARRRRRSRIPLTLPIGEQQAQPVPRARRQHHLRRRVERRAGLQAQAPEPPRPALRAGGGPDAGARRATAAPRRREVTRRTLRDHDPAYTLDPAGHERLARPDLPEAGARRLLHDRRRCGRSSTDVKDWDSLPVLATIIPVNPDLRPRGPQRLVRRDERPRSRRSPRSRAVTLADLNAEFKAAGSLRRPLRRRRAPERRRLPGAWPRAGSRPSPAPARPPRRPRPASASASAL